ncbi:MAG: dienelactone hydrolase family protein [Dehalococcoidia bacterium]
MELARIQAPSGTLKALLASPRHEGPRPGLIIIHEVMGLNSDMRAKAQRFADMGYVTLAPDLFSTRGPMPLCIMRTVRGLKDGKGPVFADLDACRGWLADRPEVDASRIGVVGFCMGGGIALLFAVRGEVGAAAVFYGSVPKEQDDLDGVCPVLGGFGGRDRVFGKNGKLLAHHLQGLQVANDVVTYPKAGHSYMSDHKGVLAKLNSWGPTRVGYNPAAAEDSWKRMETFFETHLGEASPPAAH